MTHLAEGVSVTERRILVIFVAVYFFLDSSDSIRCPLNDGGGRATEAEIRQFVIQRDIYVPKNPANKI